MYRREIPGSKHAMSNEFKDIWDAIERIRISINRTILPDGYTWSITDQGKLCIINPSNQVTIIEG